MPEETPSNGEVTKELQAEASSAHSRLNIPLNLENWKALPQDTVDALLWFHQYCLDHKLTLQEAGHALNYNRSTVFKILKGNYEGSWKNVVDNIRSYRRITEQRGEIQRQEFVPNSITHLIHGALDYAVANNSITLIIGESRMGKSIAAEAWRDEHNHGRSVLVRMRAVGGTKGLLRSIAGAVGVNKDASTQQVFEGVCRSFNNNRILLVDEAHRALAWSRSANPTSLETLRDIHDLTGCALALIATERFTTELRKSSYQYEQLLGRIGLPVRLPMVIPESDIMPIVRQFVRQPSSKMTKECVAISNTEGRLGILVEVLKFASRVAKKSGQTLNEDSFFKALAIRRQMSGDNQFKKEEGR